MLFNYLLLKSAAHIVSDKRAANKQVALLLAEQYTFIHAGCNMLFAIIADTLSDNPLIVAVGEMVVNLKEMRNEVNPCLIYLTTLGISLECVR